jgi:hypothetical protein
MQIAYRTKATASGGRDGKAVTDDGKLSVKLITPKELGGPGGEATNPEQLFAAGYRLLPQRHQVCRAQPEDRRFRQQRGQRLGRSRPAR